MINPAYLKTLNDNEILEICST